MIWQMSATADFNLRRSNQGFDGFLTRQQNFSLLNVIFDDCPAGHKYYRKERFL